MINVHLYPTNSEYETRLHRSALAAAKINIFEEVVHLALGGLSKDKKERLREKYGLNVINISNNKLSYIYRTFLFVSKKQLVINVHNWYMLVPALYSYFIFKNKIIYEPHEVEFSTGYISKPAKLLCYILEKIFFSLTKFNSVFVGCSVKNEYFRRYGKIQYAHVVYSVPAISTYNSSENRTIDADSGCYVGLFTQGRGIETYIELLEKSLLKKFIFIGTGPYRDYINSKIAEGLNIEVFKPMEEQELYTFLIKNKPICFSLMSPESLSNRCASPNKFFMYYFSSCPIIYTNYGDQGIISREFKCGKGVESFNFTELKDAILSLRSNFVSYEPCVSRFSNVKTINQYSEIYRGLI